MLKPTTELNPTDSRHEASIDTGSESIEFVLLWVLGRGRGTHKATVRRPEHTRQAHDIQMSSDCSEWAEAAGRSARNSGRWRREQHFLLIACV